MNGVTYTLDGALISDPATALTLTRGTLGTDYWMVGATVTKEQLLDLNKKLNRIKKPKAKKK